MTARALMVLGTGSHVGKSIITAGLGRILVSEGYRVAPFKAQNMSLNSAVTPDGLEIGRAQALQAEACRIAPSVEMNPILIKPRTDTSSQIVVLGKIWAQATASEYHSTLVEQLFPQVLAAFRKLASDYEVVILEGAGSPAEINLRDHDIVNMRMAMAADASCLLVGDIDRGGVFASLLGTMELLEEQERKMIKGFIINKFRGDMGLLQPGVTMIETRMGIPCLGTVPYLHDMGLEEEDGVATEDRLTVRRLWRSTGQALSPDRPLRIGVVAVPHMSNFTDFDALAAEPAVSLAYIDNAKEIQQADLVILPGSKQTLEDLVWLEQSGFVAALHQFHARNGTIMGICGGFQMLGTAIEDPQGVENDGMPAKRKGMQLLQIHTVLEPVKITRPVSGRVCEEPFGPQRWPDARFQGYEIHVGVTRYLTREGPFARVTDASGVESMDGAISANGHVFGTYVHGIFDNDSWRHAFIDMARSSLGLAPAPEHLNVTAERNAKLDRLADHLCNSLDLALVRGWLGQPENAVPVASLH